MKFKEITIVGGTVYLNIVHTEDTETMTLPAKEAVGKYGDYEVIEHQPYDGEVTETDTDEGKKNRKETPKAGTDIVILQG